MHFFKVNKTQSSFHTYLSQRWQRCIQTFLVSSDLGGKRKKRIPKPSIPLYIPMRHNTLLFGFKILFMTKIATDACVR